MSEESFFDFYGEDAPGRWYTIGTNPENDLPVQLKVRAVPAFQVEKHEAKWRKRRGGRGENAKELIVKKQDELNFAFDNAEYCWSDCKNFTVKVGDTIGAALFSKELGRSVKVGDKVSLDGNLTRAIKLAIFDKKSSIFSKVVEVARLQDEENTQDESALSENLDLGLDSE